MLSPDNCIDELERVIREALRQSMPAYLVISQANGIQPVIGTPVIGQPLSSIKRQHSGQQELDAASEAFTTLLRQARQAACLLNSW